jgi:thiamine-phosphate pyrophosphorylase
MQGNVVSHLYPIFDSYFLPEDPALRRAFLGQTLEEFASLGLTVAQLRWKDADALQLRESARAMHAEREGSLRCILNDHVSLARDLCFAGVHLGQQDMAAGEARRMVGPDAIVGVSTHNVAQVEAADRLPVDYIAIGPVFSTSTKRDAEPLIGLEGVRAARALTRKPLVAIGGITLHNAASVREAGADSVAVISALFGDPTRSPGKLAEDFLRRLR